MLEEIVDIVEVGEICIYLDYPIRLCQENGADESPTGILW